MTIRIRLALFFTLLVGCILALVGVTTYKLLRHGLLAEIERDVARRAAVFAGSSPGPPYNLDVFAAPDVFLQVVDTTGPIASSGNLGLRVLPLPLQARAGSVVEVRVVGRPLYLTAAQLEPDRHVIVARSPRTIYAALRRLRQLLYLVIGASLLVTASLGWLFAGAVVRPIDRVARAAAAVKDSRDLKQRVTYTGPPDELGKLAATFNAMLAELDQAYRSLDQSNERLRQFLADAAHELRAPLTLMLSNLDLLRKLGDADPSFREQALVDIRREADRMARMITQLLILGRAEAGAQVSSEPVALAEVLTDACRQSERIANGVRFIAPDVRTLEGVRVQGNADYLKQLILILLDNAFKYTPAGGEVRVEAADAQGAAWITVSDTGPGIATSELPRIFERFYRGESGAGHTGSGLGLAIARWVVEQHGGSIHVDSVLGRGSRFTVRLPTLPEGAPGLLGENY